MFCRKNQHFGVKIHDKVQEVVYNRKKSFGKNLMMTIKFAFIKNTLKFALKSTLISEIFKSFNNLNLAHTSFSKA